LLVSRLSSFLCSPILSSLSQEEIILFVNWSYPILYGIRPLSAELVFTRLKRHIHRLSFQIVNATCEWLPITNANYTLNVLGLHSPLLMFKIQCNIYVHYCKFKCEQATISIPSELKLSVFT